MSTARSVLGDTENSCGDLRALAQAPPRAAPSRPAGPPPAEVCAAVWAVLKHAQLGANWRGPWSSKWRANLVYRLFFTRVGGAKDAARRQDHGPIWGCCGAGVVKTDPRTGWCKSRASPSGAEGPADAASTLTVVWSRPTFTIRPTSTLFWADGVRCWTPHDEKESCGNQPGAGVPNCATGAGGVKLAECWRARGARAVSSRAQFSKAKRGPYRKLLRCDPAGLWPAQAPVAKRIGSGVSLPLARNRGRPPTACARRCGLEGSAPPARKMVPAPSAGYAPNHSTRPSRRHPWPRVRSSAALNRQPWFIRKARLASRPNSQRWSNCKPTRRTDCHRFNEVYESAGPRFRTLALIAASKTAIKQRL